MKKLIIFLGILLFSKTFYVDKGWNLLGSSEEINVTNFDVDIVWRYDGNWSYFSRFYHLNYPKFEVTKKNDGFWVFSKKNIIFSDRKVLILPLYFYDTAKWKKVSTVSNDEIIIINPSNGPGDEIDENYKNFLKTLSDKVPIGYVFSNYSKRSLEDIKKDIDKWLLFYPQIRGFFIDEVSEDNFNYYKQIFDYIKSKGNYLVVLNPGTIVDDNYFDISDIVVVYEDNKKEFAKYCDKFPQKSALIVFNANKDDMKKLVEAKCRYIFITDEEFNNYSDLPSYFDEELKLLK